MPRSTEKFYIIYDKTLNDCNPKILEENFIKGNYIICDESKFINFTKNKEKNSSISSLQKINNYTITSKQELLKRFSNPFSLRVKNSYDLLNRYKNFDFNLIIKDTILDKIKIIPVEYTQVLCLTYGIDQIIKIE